MDDELEALMASFTQAQQAKSSARLSERNVIELVNKLQELALLEPLIYTINGRDYLTQAIEKGVCDLPDEALSQWAGP
eukprot:237635-Prorocentrum_minimum.AAC.3